MKVTDSIVEKTEEEGLPSNWKSWKGNGKVLKIKF